jgi:preprotein translocase subunit YajC
MNPIFPSSILALQAAGGASNPLTSLVIPMLLMFGVFYFVLLMPMQKQRKALQQVIESLKKGDKVLTSGGLYGEVVSVDASTVILRVADNVRVKVAKSAISGLEGEASDKGSDKGNKGSQSS